MKTPPVVERNWRPWLAAGAALSLIVGAAWVSHEWNEEAGLDVVYVILGLVVVALALPYTREWLAAATNVKLPGGLEITRELADAIETISRLPIADEEEEDAQERLKVIDADWHEEPAVALGALRAKLREQIDWIKSELYPGRNFASDRAVLDRLEDDDLINAQERRIAAAVLEVSSRVIATGYDSDSDAVRDATAAFMKGADRIVSQLRLRALDTTVRIALKRARGLKIMDFGPQPRGRWPDFFVYHPKFPNTPLRVAVRMARTKGGSLVKDTRERMRRKSDETPLDPLADRIIVVPNTSETILADEDEASPIRIPAMKRDAFVDFVNERFTSEAG